MLLQVRESLLQPLGFEPTQFVWNMLEPPTYGSLNRKKDETPVGMMISTEATGLFGMGFTAEQMALEVVVPEKNHHVCSISGVYNDL